MRRREGVRSSFWRKWPLLAIWYIAQHAGEAKVDGRATSLFLHACKPFLGSHPRGWSEKLKKSDCSIQANDCIAWLRFSVDACWLCNSVFRALGDFHFSRFFSSCSGKSQSFRSICFHRLFRSRWHPHSGLPSFLLTPRLRYVRRNQ